jgi:hypothetical protein
MCKRRSIAAVDPRRAISTRLFDVRNRNIVGQTFAGGGEVRVRVLDGGGARHCEWVAG